LVGENIVQENVRINLEQQVLKEHVRNAEKFFMFGHLEKNMVGVIIAQENVIIQIKVLL